MPLLFIFHGILRKEWAFYPKNRTKIHFSYKESYKQQSAFDDFYDFQCQISPKLLLVHICVNSNEKGKMLKAKCLERLREAQM